MIDIERSRLSYREHEWAVYWPEPDERPATDIAQGAPWLVCDSDSPRAHESWGASPHRFYFDLELLAADLPTTAGGHLATLAEPWRGHPAGALVLSAYVRDENSEPGIRIVYAVADCPHGQVAL